MRVILLRHGQTAWNALRRVQGHSDIPLDEQGLEQARRAAAELAAVPFDRIVSSPLRRALQTAQIVAEGRGLEIEIEPLLIEMAFGENEGTTYEEFPGTFFTAPEQYVPAPGGEDFAQLDERCRLLLEERLPQWAETSRCVLLCTHGALTSAVIRRVTARPLSDFWMERRGNCSRVVLEWDGGAVRLIDK